MSMRRHRRGATAVEFALTIPIPILFLLGVVEYGTAISQREALVNVARDAANSAVSVVRESAGDTEGVVSRGNARAEALLETYGVSCGSGCTVSTTVASQTLDVVTVQVVAPYAPMFSLIPSPSQLRAAHSLALPPP